jgi:peptidoglycan/xylan/chitin deacetylase (PgdA/CDA1 family)
MRIETWLASILVAVFVVLANSVVCEAANASPDKRVTVVFRFDDYSETSDTEMEVKLINAFRQRGVCCTFSIIPFICKGSTHDSREQGVIPLSTTKADILKGAVEAGAVELALHGYAHQTIRDTGGWTEFIGLGYDAQFAKLKKGKDFVEQMLAQPVTIFVPPWNSYDSNTAQALGDLGFRCLSAATFGVGEGPSSLKFLPATSDLLQLRQAVEVARRRPDADRLVVALFHAYDFVEADKVQGIMTYQELIELLDWLVSQSDVDVRSMSEVINMDIDLSGRRLAANGSFAQWPDYVPPFMPGLVGVPTGVYLSSDAVDGLAGTKSRLYVGTGLFYLVVALAPAVFAFVLGRVVCSRSALLAALARYGVLILLAAALVYGGRNLQLGYRGALVIFGLFGACAGIWAGRWPDTKRRRDASTT